MRSSGEERGGEGVDRDADPAKGTSPIADDAEKEQTQAPAAEDDVGVPSDTQDRTD
jgi:hypothetical protein